MNQLQNNFGLFALCSLLLLAGCEGFFGNKTDRSFIDEPQFDDKQIAYVPIQPVIRGFAEPVDIIAGFDELLYVADAGSEQIISLDLAGNELARLSIPGVKSIVQDRTLDLLALGRLDTVVDGSNVSLACIYRIDLKSNGGYGLNNAVIERKIVHPFYVTVNFDKGADPLVEFNGIAIMHDNWYYVTRNGSRTSSLFPDDAVLVFNDEDKFLTTVTVQTSAGFFTDYFKSPGSIVTLTQPPQSPVLRTERDFIFTSLDATAALNVQYIQVEESENGIAYKVKELVVGDSSLASGFLYDPFRFSSPADVTYSGDGTNFIFVVDYEKDSVYQFTSNGYEGVNPPFGAEDKRNIVVSFGGTGESLTQFKQPRAVAYLNKILYVADAGNSRVLRFQLTTDFQ